MKNKINLKKILGFAFFSLLFQGVISMEKQIQELENLKKQNEEYQEKIKNLKIKQLEKLRKQNEQYEKKIKELTQIIEALKNKYNNEQK